MPPVSRLPSELPTPEAQAAASSAQLCARIRAEIGRAGWMPFARYMELALYAPGLGYYSAGTSKFGPAGDFVTAPELSPLFAQVLARQVAQLMEASAPQVFEAGGGSGALAAELLLELTALGVAPQRYTILEVSGELRQRQAATLAARAPQLAERVVWAERLPDTFAGVVIANEVLDAMPVQLVRWQADGILERGVGIDRDDAFVWVERPAEGPLLEAARALAVDPPYTSEINLAARAWTRTWGEILDRGALLLVDYGFPRHEYYHPQRSEGTLMCHYRHRAHGDPFLLPGLNDITAHVDFSAIADAGTDAGLALLGYCNQAQFLLNCGMAEIMQRHDPDDIARFAPLAASANKLISPAEMGELFKVITLGRHIDAALIGFAQGDRSHTL